MLYRIRGVNLEAPPKNHLSHRRIVVISEGKDVCIFTWVKSGEVGQAKRPLAATAVSPNDGFLTRK